MNISLINGESGTLPLNHRGLAYGDGVFETLLMHRGKIQFLNEHLTRMNNGSARIGLRWSEEDSSNLKQRLSQLCEGETKPHIVKIILVRNSPLRGYDFCPENQSTDVIVQINPYERPDWAVTGAAVIVAKTKINENESLAGIKHLNRLDSILAKQNARAYSAHEALMLDSSGCVIEGSMSNVFFRINGQWQTPRIEQSGVAGIIREILLLKNSDFRVRRIPIEHIDDIESAFICNSLIGVVAVSSLEGKPLYIHPDIVKLRNEIEPLCD